MRMNLVDSKVICVCMSLGICVIPKTKVFGATGQHPDCTTSHFSLHVCLIYYPIYSVCLLVPHVCISSCPFVYLSISSLVCIIWLSQSDLLGLSLFFDYDYLVISRTIAKIRLLIQLLLIMAEHSDSDLPKD